MPSGRASGKWCDLGLTLTRKRGCRSVRFPLERDPDLRLSSSHLFSPEGVAIAGEAISGEARRRDSPDG
jgi:hypothetical protein